MSRRIVSISNLLELIENGTVTITSVQVKTKAFADYTETDNVTPTDFIESLQYLNKSKLFKDAVDFCYEFSGKDSLLIECGMKSPYLDEYFYAECVIKDGAIARDVVTKLRETVFDRMDEKISV